MTGSTFKKTLICMAILIAGFFVARAYATEEVESKEEMLGYIRVLLSNERVLSAYESLVKEGYVWLKEYGNFGSMHDDASELELFTGQIQIVLSKSPKSEKGAQKNEYKTLIITFTWSRKLKEITAIDSIEVYKSPW